MSKTFRLFISSTFRDFQKERELLQTKVFPEIREYCRKKGFKFQPVDLRWGVSREAQLDQKTLELCLNEVRSCKSHPHPNFLIMIGEHYGSVFLPYMIEKREYVKLRDWMSSDEIGMCEQWYREDLNQIPVSYILQERTGHYEDYDTWKIVEDKLITLLQRCAQEADFSEDVRRKYFISATEAEVEEGIFEYIKPTPHQIHLQAEKQLDPVMDTESIFGFFKGNTEDHNVKAFKDRVRSLLKKENLHRVKNSELNEDEKETFVLRVTDFLKQQVDAHGQKQLYTPLEEEQTAQDFYATKKRKNFVGQETLLSSIAAYLDGSVTEALVLHGRSGSGKSAIMAKAIEQAEERKSHRCIFRFVGVTPVSGSSKEILLSIMEELGHNLWEEKKGSLEIGGSKLLTGYRKQETFEEFSHKVNNLLSRVEDKLVIFIDAVDQLMNEDYFLWLPKTLPEHLKIVITALQDENYEHDSKYFEHLKEKTSNLLLVTEFTEPFTLLRGLLAQENRTIQPHQQTYFLQQFQKVQTPFYVYVAAQEIKHWNSWSNNQELADTQQGIVSEFIENLTELYHHDKSIVEKVLGYIYASRDGLSEDELLQLFAIDDEFVKEITEKFDNNESTEFPMVLWTRLYTQLTPFLSLKVQDREELLGFFHREFRKIIGSDSNLPETFFSIVRDTKQLILKHQEEPFSFNHWGRIYNNLLLNFKVKSIDPDQHISFLATLHNTDWIEEYYKFDSEYFFEIYHGSTPESGDKIALYHYENTMSLIKKMIHLQPFHWLKYYLHYAPRITFDESFYDQKILTNILSNTIELIEHYQQYVSQNEYIILICELTDRDPIWDLCQKEELRYEIHKNVFLNHLECLDQNPLQTFKNMAQLAKILNHYDLDKKYGEVFVENISIVLDKYQYKLLLFPHSWGDAYIKLLDVYNEIRDFITGDALNDSVDLDRYKHRYYLTKYLCSQNKVSNASMHIYSCSRLADYYNTFHNQNTKESNKNYLEKSKQYYEESFEILQGKNIKNWQEEIWFIQTFCKFHFENKDYYSCINVYETYSLCFDQCSFSTRSDHALEKLFSIAANAYYKVGSDDQALVCIQKVVNYFDKHRKSKSYLDQNRLYALNLLGHLLYRKGNKDDALNAYRGQISLIEILDNEKQIKNYEQYYLELLEWIVEIYEEMKDYHNAIQYTWKQFIKVEKMFLDSPEKYERKYTLIAFELKKLYHLTNNEISHDSLMSQMSKNFQLAGIDLHQKLFPSIPTKRNAPCPCGSGKKYKKCCG